MRWPSRANSVPSADSSTAPTGTSPRAAADFASSSANAMASVSFMGAGVNLAAAKRPDGPKPEGDRIAKVIARAGICSRRDAEKLILEGRVKLDGVVITSPALNVTTTNLVMVNDKLLAEPEGARMWRYHKPSGLVTTH